MKLLQNKYVVAFLVLFIFMYGPKLHPTLPDSIRNLFNNKVFKILILFLIVYLSNRDLSLSLTLIIIYIVLNQVINYVRSVENFVTINGLPVSNCTNYNKEDIEKYGTIYYPIN